VQVKLWDPLRTRAIPERLRGVFTTRRYTNPRLPLPLLLPPETSGRLNCKSQIRHCSTVLPPLPTRYRRRGWSSEQARDIIAMKWAKPMTRGEISQFNVCRQSALLIRRSAASITSCALIRSIIGYAAIQVTWTCQYRHTDTDRETDRQTDRQTERWSPLDARRDRSHALCSPATRTTSDICIDLSFSDARTQILDSWSAVQLDSISNYRC